MVSDGGPWFDIYASLALICFVGIGYVVFKCNSISVVLPISEVCCQGWIYEIVYVTMISHVDYDERVNHQY